MGLLVVALPVFANVPLSSVVLQVSFPGMSLITSSQDYGNVGSEGGIIPGLVKYSQQTSPYVNTWISTWENQDTGDEVAIEAVEMSTSNDANTVFNETIQRLKNEKPLSTSISTFSTAPLSGGYGEKLVKREGKASITALQLLFVANQVLFVVRVDSTSTRYSPKEVIDLSLRQQEQSLKLVPNVPSSGISGSEVLFAISGAGIFGLIAAIVYVIRQSKGSGN